MSTFLHMTPPIRWGILGTGKIARKFVADLEPTTGVAYAVGSRSSEKAAAFAQEHEMPKAYGSYEALVTDPEVDVVYISSPHSGHYEHTLLCLNAGKHVLCEKPMAVYARQATEMVDLAREKNLFLMEALWMYFLPTFQQTQRWIADGRIGEVTMIRAEFGFPPAYEPESRLFNPALAGGALLDIGIYPLTLALRLAGAPLKNLQSAVKKAPTGVDMATVVQAEFENGVLASLTSTFESRMVNEAVIYGTEGHIHMPLFWSGTNTHLNRNGEVTTFTDDRTTFGYNFEAEAVHECLRQGQTQSPIMDWKASLELIQCMDQIRHAHQILYPFEN
ncbi:MAG TPA: dehydrogenase [Cytophagales bacterium]|nr:dehydrogenase [Cytophagales bacterium]HAA22248.1 dehydrogenase [Cytophagales bacterium]HAP63289.1 dehydrogenase [Cytophagales bacterium]